MAGGAPIVISGLDMADTAEFNSLVLEPHWIEGAELLAPALSCK